ncbi:hypothetical protein [Dongshaea marina]|nr:hypothetical protein [Dongshaea marina]
MILITHYTQLKGKVVHMASLLAADAGASDWLQWGKSNRDIG